jgi:hypothetical protein
MTNRRDILKGMALGLTAPLLISGEKVAELLPPEAPAPAANDELWLAPKETGVDYDGILAAIFIEAVEGLDDPTPQQFWLTRPDGTVLMQHAFHPHLNFQWMAEPDMMIIGPVNLSCSCTANIFLAGPRPDSEAWKQVMKQI